MLYNIFTEKLKGSRLFDAFWFENNWLRGRVMIKRHTHDNRKQKGQGLVEFALVFPIFLLLVYGIFEVARAIFMYSAVLNASRDAARYAAAADNVQSLNAGYTPFYMDCEGIRNRARRVSSFVDLSATDAILISYDHGPNTKPDDELLTKTCETLDPILQLGDRINVTVTANFNPIVPLVDLGQIPISSTTTRTLVSGVNIWK